MYITGVFSKPEMSRTAGTISSLALFLRPVWSSQPTARTTFFFFFVLPFFSPNPPHSRAPFSSPSPPFENFSARRPQNFQITRPFPWSFLKIHPLASTLTITAMDRALAASIGTIQTLNL